LKEYVSKGEIHEHVGELVRDNIVPNNLKSVFIVSMEGLVEGIGGKISHKVDRFVNILLITIVSDGMLSDDIHTGMIFPLVYFHKTQGTKDHDVANQI
jgi:hypothetical protein